MEESLSNNVVPATTNQINQSVNGSKTKKQRFSLFNAAMLMLRTSGNEKPKPVKVTKPSSKYNNIPSDAKWKKIVGSMRPLHLQVDQSPPPGNAAIDRFVVIPSSERSEGDDSLPTSPASSWGTSSRYASTNNLQELAGSGSIGKKSFSVGNLQELAGTGGMIKSASMSNLRRTSGSCMSQYASAIDLLQLDGDDEEGAADAEENDKVLENNYAADVMIDSKADEFIAQFYQQMRSQDKDNE